MSDVLIFAPAPVLTITIEDHPDGADVHLHSGAQGVWQARMALALGRTVGMCATFSGESGRIVSHLLRDEGIELFPVYRDVRGGAYVHDRRGGERTEIVAARDEAIERHDLDELYGVTLREGLTSPVVILSGPAGDGIVAPDIYRRLAADLGHGDCRVIVDLAGERLEAALAGGVDVAKVSDDELRADGRLTGDSVDEIADAIHRIRDEGARSVIVTRAGEPLLLLHHDRVWEYTPPPMEVVDTTGAGDSLTGAVASALATGASLVDAVRLGAAAGALNVTRHGLGTGDAGAIERIRDLVSVRELDAEPPTAHDVSPDELATRIEER